MSTWPSTLPGIRLPVEAEHQDGILRTAMDAGPQKARRRFNATSAFYTVPMRMTGTQLGTLNSFYDNNLMFTFENPETGDNETFRWASPLSYRAVVGNETPGNRIWDVTLNLERLP